MEKLLKLNKTMPARTVNGEEIAGMETPFERILKLPLKAYNALFTPMGRKNLYYYTKKARVEFSLGYRRNGTLVYSLANGNQFVLHRGNRLSELVYLEGAYDTLETLIVSKIAQPGDMVIDVGANVGYYTALLNGLVKPNGLVHSFEPGQGTFHQLEETKKLLHLDNSKLYPKAVSHAVGTIDFWLSTSGSDAQQGTVKTVGLGQQARCKQVAATTLDAFLIELNATGAGTIAFVKCDIEGAEFSMLKGAQTLLNSQNPPFWLIEHNRKVLWGHGANSAELLACFVNSDVFVVPVSWPPSSMTLQRPSKWNGVADDLPDECNLLICPRRGIYANRVALLKQAGLIV